MKLYDGFPYGGERTAGHGIAYVRTHMLPERGPRLQMGNQSIKNKLDTMARGEPVSGGIVKKKGPGHLEADEIFRDGLRGKD